MGAPTGMPKAAPRTIESLFRDHLAAMHRYANELADVLGRDSPIVRRIHDCAISNREALDHISKCKECGK